MKKIIGWSFLSLVVLLVVLVVLSYFTYPTPRP